MLLKFITEILSRQ